MNLSLQQSQRLTRIFAQAQSAVQAKQLHNAEGLYLEMLKVAHPYAFNLENLGFHYKQYQRIMRHRHRVLPGRILDINYEDTIGAPEYWSRKLTSYLGLEWDDAY